MSCLVKSLLRRLESTDKQVSDIRSDYANFESENSHSLKEAEREIEVKSKALAELEAEGQALQAKNAKLRDNNERLQATIDEHRQVNEELQTKLKHENKINQGKPSLTSERSEEVLFLRGMIWDVERIWVPQIRGFP